MWELVIIILIILIVFSTFSHAKKQDRKIFPDINNLNKDITCKASAALICWKRKEAEQNPEAVIKKALGNIGITFNDLNSQVWNPEDSTIGGIRDYKLSKISSAGTSYDCILLHLNSQLGSKISSELSRSLKTPVIAFLEFHQMAWGYCLYEDGKAVDQFCNDPNEIEESPSLLKGNIDILTKIFSSDRRNIEPYLIHINNDETLTKAFPDDEFVLDDHWVRVDFMKRLGIIYPDKGKWLFLKEKGINY